MYNKRVIFTSRIFFICLLFVFAMVGKSEAEDELKFCPDKLTYDCLVEEIFSEHIENNYDYINFNNNLRPYLSFFYEVEDLALLRKVEKALRGYEKNGILSLYDDKAKKGKKYFDGQSIRLKHAAILDALNEHSQADIIRSKYEILPETNLEKAHYQLNKGNLKEAYMYLNLIEDKDLPREPNAVYFDSSTIENRMLSKLLDKAVREEKYVIAEGAVNLFSQFPTGDEGVTSERAKKHYIMTKSACFRDKLFPCVFPENLSGSRKKLICRIHNENLSMSDSKELLSDYLSNCKYSVKDCLANLLQIYHNEKND